MSATDPSDVDRAFAARDVRRFDRALGRARPDTDALARYLRAADDPIRLAVLRHLETRVAQATSASELESLAALLPQEPGGAPEAHLALAELYRRLWPWHAARALPAWRERELPVPVALAWVRTELVVDPAGALRAATPARTLRRAASAVTAAEVLYPELLVAELAAHADALLHAEALRLARGCLARGGMLPRDAHRALLALCDSPHAPTAAAAFAGLAEPWARPWRLPPSAIERGVLRAGPVGDAALRCAGARGERRVLRELASDPARPGTTRRAALAELGRCAERDELGPLLDLAASDPALFGPPCVAFARAMHRRGLFVPASHAPVVLALYLATDDAAPAELAPLLFPCRDALLAAAARDVAADDPRAARLAPLLLALALGPQGARPLAALDALCALLRDTRTPAVARAAIAALGALRDPAAEPALLAQLDAMPREVLAALECVGGEATREALRARLGLGSAPSAPPPLRAAAREAVALLWRLSVDLPEARAELVARLDPHALPHAALAELGRAPDARERALLLHAHAYDPVPREARERVTTRTYLYAAARGDAPDAVDLVAQLLRRLVTEIDHGEVRDEMQYGEAARAIEPPVLDAIREMGARRFARGHIRPACLAGARDGAAAGDALLAELLHAMLAREGELSAGETAVVLRALEHVRSPRTFAAVHRLWRHPDPTVRALALRQCARDGAAWMLAVNLRQLLADESTDLVTLRAAIEAVGAARDDEAGALLASCLDHPNMNVKKAAAEALGAISAPAAADKLLAWLGRHDNPGLREDLVRALRGATGEAYSATVLAALDTLGDTPAARETARRLLLALSGELTVDAVRAVARRAPPWAEWFFAEVFAGASLRLQDGADARVLAAQVGWSRARSDAPRERGRAPAAPASPGPASAIRALAAAGWTDAGARAVLAELAGRAGTRHEALSTAEAALVCPYARGWTALLAVPECAPGAARLLAGCLAAGSAPARAVLADALGALWAQLERTRGALRASLLALVAHVLPELSRAERWQLAARLRALPVEPALPGDAPFALLRACDALLVRADLDRELAACAGCAEPDRPTRVLRAAFPLGERGAPLSTDARARLESALGAPDAPTELRVLAADWTDHAAATLDALIELYPRATPAARPALLDWLEALQPLGAPRDWLTAAPQPAARELAAPQPDDLDQPPSRAQLARLDALCTHAEPATRRRALLALLRWPGADVRRRAAALALRTDELDLDATLTAQLPAALADASPADLADVTDAAALARAAVRVANAFFRAPAAAQRAWTPWLLARWAESTAPRDRAAIAQGVGAQPADALLEHLAPALERGEWGWLELVHTYATRTPWLERILADAARAGRADLVARIPVEGSGLRAADAAEHDAQQLAERRARRAPATPLSAQPRADLLALARGADPDRARAAMSELSRDPDPALVALLHARLRDRNPRLRLHAHRLLRRCTDRASYLDATVALLADPLPDVRRAAVRALTYGSHAPSIPAIIERLGDTHAAVRREADAGLARWGAAALGPLRHALSRARPDRRPALSALIGRIERAADGSAGPGSANIPP